MLSVADDARYAKRRLELAYPGHPQGRAVQGVELAVQDSALELQEGRCFAELLRPFEALIEGQIAAMGTETYQRNHGG